MSTPNISNYFKVQKRSDGVRPSKRRKVSVVEENVKSQLKKNGRVSEAKSTPEIVGEETTSVCDDHLSEILFHKKDKICDRKEVDGGATIVSSLALPKSVLPSATVPVTSVLKKTRQVATSLPSATIPATSSLKTIRQGTSSPKTIRQVTSSLKTIRQVTSLPSVTPTASPLLNPTLQATTSQTTSSSQSSSQTASLPSKSCLTTNLPSAISQNLTLPFRYKEIFDKFVGMDTVVNMLQRRKEVCTFTKLKNGVQQLTRKNFTEKHLSQILTVYPEAYTVTMQKLQTGYHLVIEANLGLKETLSRRERFRNLLLHRVLQQHKSFLSSLTRPLSIPDNELTRWHPDFPLSKVTDIEETELPKPPATLIHTAQSYLELISKSEAKRATAKTTGSTEANKVPVESTKVEKSCEEVEGIRGLSPALLEKIRAKEAKRKVEALTRNPEEDKRQARLERLPELSRILRTYFISQKKQAILEEDVVKKLSESHKSNLGKAEIEKHLQLLEEMGDIQVIKIRTRSYVKLNVDKLKQRGVSA